MKTNTVGRLMPAPNPKQMILSLSGLSPHYVQNNYAGQANHGFNNSFPPNYIDIGEYEPPSLAKPDKLWEPPSDIDMTYQKGSTTIRQENNESIDDYYERLMRKPSEFTQPTPNGRPTILYQNLQESKSLDKALAAETARETSPKKKQSKSRSSTKQATENKDQTEKQNSTNNKSTSETIETVKNNQTNETKRENDQAANQTQKSTIQQQSNVVIQQTQNTTAQPAQNKVAPAQIAQNNIPPAQPAQTKMAPAQIAQNTIPPAQPGRNIQQTAQRIAPPQQSSGHAFQAVRGQTQAAGYSQQILRNQAQTTGQNQQILRNPAQSVGYNQQVVRNQTQATGNIQQAIQGQHQVANQAQQVRPIANQPVGGISPTAKLPKLHPANPVVFFDFDIDDEERGRLVIELFRHALPKTSQNFLSLCLGDRGFGYKYSYLHRIIPGFMAQGGDFEKSDGTGGHSIYGPTFNDEGFPFKHDRAGLLSMANSGPNTNGSQFFVTFAPAPHLDGKHTVFGQVLQGYHLLDDFRLSGSESGEPIRAVRIANCGQLQ